MSRHPRPKTTTLAAATLVAGGIALAACGRNPGAQPRGYPIPGLQEIESRLDRANPKCVAVFASSLGKKALVQGKELFAAERAGVFRLERYEVEQLGERPFEGSRPNLTLTVTDFDDLVSSSPRLSIESPCMDTKGIDQELALSPVVEIDSEQGLIRSSQPFTVTAIEDRRLEAKSDRPVPSPQPVPVARIPSEAAMLLGGDYAGKVRTAGFRVKENDDGSLVVEATFVGADPGVEGDPKKPPLNLVLRVRAVYRWDAAA